jgi:hypothetical protein
MDYKTLFKGGAYEEGVGAADGLRTARGGATINDSDWGACN